MKIQRIIPLIVAITLTFLTTGCSIYRTKFDCPPGKGIGCASASEVLDMIQEEDSDSDNPFDSGENLFLPVDRSCR